MGKVYSILFQFINQNQISLEYTFFPEPKTNKLASNLSSYTPVIFRALMICNDITSYFESSDGNALQYRDFAFWSSGVLAHRTSTAAATCAAQSSPSPSGDPYVPGTRAQPKSKESLNRAR